MGLTGLTWYLVVLGVCLLCSAFFSSSETALLSLPRARLFKLAKSHRRGPLIRQAVARPDKLLGAILLGNNLFNVLGSVAGTALALGLWGEKSLAPAAAGLTLLFLVLAEITPKTLAAFKPESVSLLVIRPLGLFVAVFDPVIGALTLVSRGLLKLTGQAPTQARTVTREDLVTLVLSGRREGYLNREEQEMLRSVLELGRITLGGVMQPLNRIVALDGSQSVDQALSLATDWPYSRYPVFEGSLEKIVGYVHLRDLLTNSRQAPVRTLIHQPTFVPESRSVQDQLLAFRQEQSHLAFVVDEFGRVLGLVTLEDVLEEIVGEILDEYDTRTAPIKSVGSGWLLDGWLTVRSVNRLTGLNLPQGPYHTLSGLVQALAQKIPAQGEVYHWQGWQLKVEKMDGKAVGRLKISRASE